MPQDLSATKPKLLYVDDERPNLVAFRALLRDTYEVLIAESAYEAFQLLESHDIPLIVSDQRMPGMTGTEMLEKVAAAYPDTMRMILTGYSDIDAVITAINRSQIYYYFKKPWNESEVRLTLANALESVMMRRQLIENECRFRSTFEHAGLGIAHLELQGLILRANVQLQDFLGVVEAELVGKPLKTWFTQFNPDELMTTADGQGGTVVRESSVVTPLGERWSRVTSSVSLNRKGKPDYLIALVDDLTERRQTEEQILKLLQAVEQSPLSIIITDKDGIIEFVNPKFAEVSGYQAHEMIGRQPSIMESGQTPDTVYKRLWACMTSGSIWEGEMLNRKKNGDLFWERVTIAPVRNKQGIVINYLWIKEDITERNKLEEQLRQAQKMEAIGQLAGGVAHDFNNILTAIIGFSTLLKMGNTLDPLSIERVDQIIMAAERAAKLTGGLLAFSRKQTLNPQKTNLNDVVQNVQKFLVRIIGEDILLTTVFKHEPIKVYVDSSQIEQVLINLATNARDAMPMGGQLSIVTELQTLDNSFVQAHGYGEPGQYAVVTVSDTGCGMDEDTRNKIFEPFFTTKEVGKGTGLGMAIVYGTIKHHKGFISVYSEQGEGTVFRLYIPATDSEEESGKVSITQIAPKGGTETILVAEDDPDVRMFVETFLKEYGYEVILAEDGQDCIEKFMANQDRISLILMDVIMPKKNGKEAFEAINRLQPGVKVLYSSGYTSDIILKKGLSVEETNLIMKPVQPLDLLLKIREVLDS
jgi:two-component system, cell cycle sensor histidine kinase and response regulator CckA